MTSMFRSLSPARAGVFIMLLGMLLFALNDAMAKWLIESYSVGQVTLVRSLAAVIVLAPFVIRGGVSRLFRVERPGLQAARVMFSTIEIFSFYFAVSYLPLADVMTYWLAAPIYVAALSPFLLGEKVGWRRWSAIAIGFCGVLVALKPGAAMLTAPALVSILGSAAFAFMMISGRQLRNTPDGTLAFWQIIGAGLAGACFAPFDWQPLRSVADVGFLSLLGVVAMCAHVLVNRALKLADATAVAPLQYTLLLWAVIFGWLFFGDVPSATLVAGAALIVLSGLYIFFRENSLKQKTAHYIPETAGATSLAISRPDKTGSATE